MGLNSPAGSRAFATVLSIPVGPVPSILVRDTSSEPFTPPDCTHQIPETHSLSWKRSKISLAPPPPPINRILDFLVPFFFSMLSSVCTIICLFCCKFLFVYPAHWPIETMDRGLMETVQTLYL